MLVLHQGDYNLVGEMSPQALSSQHGGAEVMGEDCGHRGHLGMEDSEGQLTPGSEDCVQDKG